LRGVPEYEMPFDPLDPALGPRWKNFDYELACAELCGSGHYSMKKVVKIVTEEEYDDWLLSQTSFYDMNIKGKEGDPYKVDVVSQVTE